MIIYIERDHNIYIYIYKERERDYYIYIYVYIYRSFIYIIYTISMGMMVRMFANGPEDPGPIPGRVITKMQAGIKYHFFSLWYDSTWD